jgi:hypothetical protein
MNRDTSPAMFIPANLHASGLRKNEENYVFEKNQKKMVIYSKTIFLQP